MQFVDTLRARIALHRKYSRTLAELNELPMSIKLDLMIAGRERQLAHDAVYGK